MAGGQRRAARAAADRGSGRRCGGGASAGGGRLQLKLQLDYPRLWSSIRESIFRIDVPGYLAIAAFNFAAADEP